MMPQSRRGVHASKVYTSLLRPHHSEHSLARERTINTFATCSPRAGCSMGGSRQGAAPPLPRRTNVSYVAADNSSGSTRLDPHTVTVTMLESKWLWMRTRSTTTMRGTCFASRRPSEPMSFALPLRVEIISSNTTHSPGEFVESSAVNGNGV